MQEKINQILSEAEEFLTSAEIAEKGGWRSAANVGLALKQMKGVVHQKSPKKKMGNGMPATEYALADKEFAKGNVSLASKGDMPQGVDIDVPVVRKNRTTEMPTDKEFCNAAKVVATTAGAEVSALNARIESMEEEIGQRNREIKKLTAERDADHQDVLNWERTMEKLVGTDSLKYVVETITGMQGRLTATENSLTEWAGVGSEYECKSPAELRVFIGSLEQRVDLLKMAVEWLNEQLDAKMDIARPTDNAAAAQFVVRTPNRPPRFTKLHKNAHSVAMSSARQHGFAEVFALIPVGKAIRGAEWRPK